MVRKIDWKDVGWGLAGLVYSSSSRDTSPASDLNDPDTTGYRRTSWDHELGPLVEMSWFPSDVFTPSQLALIDYHDRQSRNIHRDKSRKTGGTVDEHTKGINRRYLDIAKQVGIQPEVSMVVANTRHDDFEEHPQVRSLQEELMSYEGDSAEAVSVRARIGRMRSNLIWQAFTEQQSFLSHLRSIGGPEKGDLSLEGALGLGSADWLTRYVEQRFFLESIRSAFERYNAREYTTDMMGGNFYKILMGRLGISGDQQEPYYSLEQRSLSRVLDRIEQTTELEPRFDRSQARELEAILEQSPQLREVHGEDIDFRGNTISRPYRLNIIYRNFVVLNFLDYALETHGSQVVADRDQDNRSYGYLAALSVARDQLIEETGNLIQTVKATYESDLKRATVSAVKDEVGDLPEEDFRVITGKGPIMHGWRNDEYNRSRIRELDSAPHMQTENYRDILISERLLGHFRNLETNVIDLDKGKVKLFTIQGLGDAPMPVSPRPYG
jgi:hypothetical protein